MRHRRPYRPCRAAPPVQAAPMSTPLDNPQWIERLVESLRQPPAGHAIQVREAPELAYGRHAGPPRWDARRAAVLMLLYPHRRQWWLPLIVRPAHMKSHAGQLALPGGLLEYGESTWHAALREFHEELGPVKDPRCLGRLSEVHVFASNSRVTPWVATAADEPRWQPSPDEVAEMVTLPISTLLDRQVTHFTVKRGPLHFSAPCLRHQGHAIWGATWIMLRQLAAAIEAVGRPHEANG